MKVDPVDQLPVVGSNSSSELGVRAGVDISVDSVGNVILDASGMSVAPEWRNLEFTRIPKRLRTLVPGATGSNTTACFTCGTGPFLRSEVSKGLELIPDQGEGPISHGVIAPHHVVSLEIFQNNIESTRANWRIDEA